MFWCVRGNPIVRGVIAGSIAASATAGALVSMGRRAGNAALPFAAIGDLVTGREVGAVDLTTGVVVAGVMLHLVMLTVWGIVFALLVDYWRGHVLRAATLVSVLAFALSWLVARAFGRGLATLLPVGDRIILALLFALALMVGMRLALPVRDEL